MGLLSDLTSLGMKAASTQGVPTTSGLDFGDLFDTVGDYASKAFDWMEENPTATGAIAGAASAGLQYLSAKEQQDYYEKKLKQEERFNARRPSSGSQGYGSHTTNLTGGTGLLATPYKKY
ncbi:hypothetical protein [Marinobacterium litorale]|uniref:hypothetical protein n=1 Tax=Marinobacterium litorale TaxID=404770 RepID=UPI0003FF93FB